VFDVIAANTSELKIFPVIDPESYKPAAASEKHNYAAH
jgi:hypothetical protein